ncbi:MAG: SymE family type I addiction module toxin [Clostridiales bacterium]|nr:SymE family type I addiction module toxin [Clostridiales bacterium]
MSDVRKLKVYYKSSGNASVPGILLKGKWLEKYGFGAGTYIAVECEEGKLTIVPTQPDEEPSLEERVCSLTKTRQKKLSKVLDEMGV